MHSRVFSNFMTCFEMEESPDFTVKVPFPNKGFYIFKVIFLQNSTGCATTLLPIHNILKWSTLKLSGAMTSQNAHFSQATVFQPASWAER